MASKAGCYFSTDPYAFFSQYRFNIFHFEQACGNHSATMEATIMRNLTRLIFVLGLMVCYSSSQAADAGPLFNMALPPLAENQEATKDPLIHT